jgi:VCBS repeat protein
MTGMGLVVAAVFAAAAGAAAVPRFSAPVVSDLRSTEWVASELLAADLNGDGKPDLVTASSGSNRLVIAIGKGDGSFHRPVAYRLGWSQRLPYDVAVGDLNGDGRPDLIVVGATFTRTVVIVLINDGGGRFHRDRVYASAAIDGAGLIAAGDVDGNGIVDVVVAGMREVQIDSRPRYGDLAVLLGTGGGQLAAPRTLAGPGLVVYDLAVGDFNADGRLDAALATDFKHAVTVRLGSSDGTFGPPRRFGIFGKKNALAVTSANLNHDGILDLAVALDGGHVGVLLGNGDGTFTAQRQYAMRSREGDVLVADLDGVGNADIATSQWYTTVPFMVRLGRGDGTFQRRNALPSFYAYSGALQDGVEDGAVADFNLDGRSDIAVATSHAEFFISDLSVLLNWTGRPAPPCVVVPVAREPVRRAQRHLENAGCRVRHVRYQDSRKVRKGRVISQRPRYGAVQVAHAGVDLVVSRGRRR